MRPAPAARHTSPTGPGDRPDEDHAAEHTSPAADPAIRLVGPIDRPATVSNTDPEVARRPARRR